jgi:antitoxin component YwqK of YwqJK toxin-antitoxin module
MTLRCPFETRVAWTSEAQSRRPTHPALRAAIYDRWTALRWSNLLQPTPTKPVPFFILRFLVPALFVGAASAANAEYVQNRDARVDRVKGECRDMEGRPITEAIVVKGYREGRLRAETPCKDGKVDGVVKAYDEDGRPLFESPHEQGKREGMEKFYDQNGTLSAEQAFKNGLLDGVVREYYEDGRLKSEFSFRRGLPDGAWKEYYPDGALKSEASFIDGKADGISRTYHENGQPKTEAAFKNDEQIGESRRYDETGQAMR